MRCWELLREACVAGEMADAADRADDLANWLHKDGVRPAAIPFVATKLALYHFARVCRATLPSE